MFFQLTQPVFAMCLNGVTLAQATNVVDHSLPTLKPELRLSIRLAVHNALIEAATTTAQGSVLSAFACERSIQIICEEQSASQQRLPASNLGASERPTGKR
ncbi:hypothetical protein AWB69_09011 [Caballeronia udeis]|uniref:Uncharacterized protein n=1 Tax=Caballeronia udeis TaxID=1232866 RepID=A0A158JX87_9BURK|nr:hypothetical protein AWB69_09011 [Caballeronia udeis]